MMRSAENDRLIHVVGRHGLLSLSQIASISSARTGADQRIKRRQWFIKATTFQESVASARATLTRWRIPPEFRRAAGCGVGRADHGDVVIDSGAVRHRQFREHPLIAQRDVTV
jgi:hypothetical protein